MTINIEFIDKMGDDLRVANIARVSFNKWKDTMDDKDKGLIKFLANHEHTTPFRHVQLQLRCTAPVYIARQLVKHSVGMSWNEVSRRYVDSEPTFHYTTELRMRPEGGIKQGSANTTVEVSDVEGIMRDAKTNYNNMVEHGIAPEVARTFLPQNMDTTWVWTGSLLGFFNVWRLCIDGHAQVEAQEFAKILGSILEEHFPESMKALREAEQHDFMEGKRQMAHEILAMINEDDGHQVDERETLQAIYDLLTTVVGEK